MFNENRTHPPAVTTRTAAWFLFVLALGMTGTREALALLGDNVRADDVSYVYFYPYRTVFLAPDPGYAFDDDPLIGFTFDAYDLPPVVKRPQVTRLLIAPRTTFVPELTDSVDDSL